MSDATANNKSIKELQRLATEAPLARPHKRKAPSRAAQLEAIDLLSRWGAAGLALIAGIGIYLSVTVGREFPTRAAAWALMLLTALWVCRRLQAQFRAGAALSARPFRWRASFVSCLSVLGVAFASAPILLTPSGAANILAVQTTVLTLIGAFGAAIFFSAYHNSAAAIAIPGALFPLLAAWRNGDGVAAIFSGLAIIAGFAVILTVRRAVSTKLGQRHPRSTLLRSEALPHSQNSTIAQEARQTA